MSTREMAFTLIEHMTESDLQLFLSLFGRLYPKQDDESETDTENRSSIEAFNRLDKLIENIPPFEVYEEEALDDYFREKYDL